MKKFVVNKIRKIQNNIKLAYCFWSDFNYYRKQNLSTGNECKDQMRAHIMLTMHQLEKGMSFTDSARFFGGQKADVLVDMVNNYIETYEKDELCKVAINVLNEYRKHINRTKDSAILAKIDCFCDKHSVDITEGIAGVKRISEPLNFDEAEIEYFFSSRSSVRDYSATPITNEEFESALHIASFTPSACNRQAARVHHIQSKEIIQKLIDNQLGSQGWCSKATSCFIVTINECYFGGGYERSQGLIDGGLYAMNFVWGLHLNHIASCFKMYIRYPKIDKEFRRISNIPENELPIVLIMAGHYKPSNVVSPKSERLRLTDGIW